MTKLLVCILLKEVKQTYIVTGAKLKTLPVVMCAILPALSLALVNDRH